MYWEEERGHLTERLEMLKRLRERFGDEVITDSDDEFSIRVSSCRYAQFSAEQGELEIGHALHCALDFGEAEAFSADISLQRTKTLMQGDAYCNHRYVRAKPARGRG